jgi:hypothetical protein
MTEDIRSRNGGNGMKKIGGAKDDHDDGRDNPHQCLIFEKTLDKNSC